MFTIPLFTDAPIRRTALVMWALIIACIAVFLWQIGLPPRAQREVTISYGVVPAVLFGEVMLPARLRHVPPALSILTSMFLHGGWLHVGGNMLYLWIFGGAVEDAMGRARFLVFYLACGTVGALAQSLADPGSTVPMIGASGAIAGVLGGYLLLHPRANVVMLLVLFVFVRFITLPAVLVLGFWFVVQLLSGAASEPGAGGTAFLAHVAGFVAGLVLMPLFRARGVGLLAPAYSPSFTMARRPQPRRRGSVPEAGYVRRGPWR